MVGIGRDSAVDNLRYGPSARIGIPLRRFRSRSQAGGGNVLHNTHDSLAVEPKAEMSRNRLGGCGRQLPITRCVEDQRTGQRHAGHHRCAAVSHAAHFGVLKVVT